MRIFDNQEVHEKLAYPVCIDLMKEALAGLERGENAQDVRTGMGLPKGAICSMPCYLGGRNVFGTKIISVYPRNAADGYPSHQGYVMLFEGDHGVPVSLADSAAITDIRTACATAAATDLLARKDSHKLTILGSGAQARTHLKAMTCIRDITEVTVWSFHKDHAERFAAEMRSEYSFPINVADTPDEAVKDADIICSVCRTREPLIKGSLVKPGTHVNVVGTCSPASREADTELAVKAKFYVDQREACMAESGDFLMPLQEGAFTEDHITGSIGDVVNGTVPARTSDEEITLFDSLGLAVEDVICADWLYRTFE